MHGSTMFEACPNCHVTYGVTYDKDNPAAVDLARIHLAQKVQECNHVGVTDL